VGAGGAAVRGEGWAWIEEDQTYFKARWQEAWGDRRQELVFVGGGIDWDRRKARLDRCLVPAILASGPDDLPVYKDPFPVWRRADEAA